MSDCTARLQLADGTVAACTWADCKRLHAVEGAGPYNELGWSDDTPGAYHVVECDACRGAGHGVFPDTYPDPATCPTCDGTGWVDPPLPLGIGSVLAQHDYPDGQYVVAEVYNDCMLLVGITSVETYGDLQKIKPCEVGPGKDFVVVRRVWQSA